jgi:tRNA modification GTPase
MLRDRNDTIAAIATPIGEAGLAVVRVSGEGSIEAVEKVFRGKSSLIHSESHTIHFGTIVHPLEGPLDQVLVSVFRSPRSYTGENSVEIGCHGSYYVSAKILETVIGAGARLADPGEFTLRAFLNGRMDLMQAEAVADLIHSKTSLAHRASMEQLNGRLSKAVDSLRQRLLELCSLLELELDFAEEGLQISDLQRVNAVFDVAITELKELIESYSFGKLIRDGVKVVLAGSPNAGKSSLLNLLLQENRAIVSEIPGTTRDVIEETIAIEGIAFRLVDTAGLRSTSDVVEQEGVKRSNSQIDSADIILLLVDSTLPGAAKDAFVNNVVETYSGKVLLVFNKIDLVNDRNVVEIPGRVECVEISCVTREGIVELEKKIHNRAVANCDPTSSSLRIQNVRHRDLLSKTMAHVASAQSGFQSLIGAELVAIDLRAAVDSLGEIIGLTTPDDVLNNIFSRFCIGK